MLALLTLSSYNHFQLIITTFSQHVLSLMNQFTTVHFLSGNTKFSAGDLQLFRDCFPQRLEFLGLFMTDMCNFPDIPADKVSKRYQTEIHCSDACVIKQGFEDVFTCIWVSEGFIGISFTA